MEISLTLLQELSEILSKDFEFYQAAKIDFFAHLSDIICLMQIQENRVFTANDIRACMCMYKILLIVNPKSLGKQISKFQSSLLSVNYITEDFIKNYTIPISIDKRNQEKLSLLKIKFNFNVDILSRVYESKGILEIYYCIYSFHGLEELDFKYSQEMVEEAKNIFENKLTKIETVFEDLDQMFLDFINDINTNFKEFIDSYFILLTTKKYRTIRKKIIKYLIYSFNCLSEEQLISVANLLNKLITKNNYYEGQQQLKQYSTNNLHHQTIDYFLKTYKDLNIHIYYRCIAYENKFTFHQELYKVSKNILYHINKIQSPYIQISFLDDNLRKIDSHNIIKSIPINNYFYQITEKDLNCEKMKEFEQSKKRPALILDLFYKHYLSIKQINDYIQDLNEENFELFIELDFQKIQKVENYYKIVQNLQKKQNPLNNYQVVESISQNISEWIKELSIKGFFMENFSDCFTFIQLQKQIYHSIEDLKHAIYFSQKLQHKKFEELFTKEAPINPFEVYFQQKIFTKLDEIQVISNQKPSLLTLCHAFYLKDLIKIDESKQAAIQSNFASQITHYSLKMPLIFNYNLTSDKNGDYQSFIKLLYNDFNVSLILPKWETFQRCSQQLFQPLFTEAYAAIKYIPLISENCYQFINSYILIQHETIYLNTKNIAFHELIIKFNFEELFHYWETNYPQYLSVIDNQGKIYHYKDLFASFTQVKLDKESIVDKFIMSIQIPVNQKTTLHDQFNYFYQLELFFQNVLNHDFIDNKIIKEFKSLLINLGVHDQNTLQLLKQCTQITSNMIYYNIFMNLIMKINHEQIALLDDINTSEFLKENKLKSVAVLTPEYGKFLKTGGLAVIIEDLVEEISLYDVDFTVIIPYFNVNQQNVTNYLSKQQVKYVFNIAFDFHGVNYQFGVHSIKEDNITFYFLHNYYLFPKIYVHENKEHQIKSLCLFNYASLFLLRHLGLLPQIIITNDWFCGFAGAFHKSNLFQDYFNKTKFLHIFHNLGEDYQGRVYLDNFYGDIQFLTGLNCNLTINPYWQKAILNPSRCALMGSDQWCTVSKSYRREILENSSLNDLLRGFKRPFAFPNGVHFNKINKSLIQLGDHTTEKWKLLQKFFDFEDEEKEEILESYILFGFLGRICEQKGVHLISGVFEQLYKKYDGKICFIVAGKLDFSEYSKHQEYALNCLKDKYPKNFWSDPLSFFYDGPSLTRGSDFFLMPSLFEPGGIVQHEALIAGTPVIAFKTGGLQDSISEFQTSTQEGNGFLFIHHNEDDFLYAFDRAIQVYEDKNSYEQLRKNASQSYIKIEDQARAWYGELCRQLDTKVFPTKIYSLNELKDGYNKQHQWVIQLKDFYKEYLSVYFTWSKDDWLHQHWMTYDEINSVWYYNGNFPVTHQEIKFFGDYEPLIVDNYGYRFSKEGFLNNFV